MILASLIIGIVIVCALWVIANALIFAIGYAQIDERGADDDERAASLAEYTPSHDKPYSR